MPDRPTSDPPPPRPTDGSAAAAGGPPAPDPSDDGWADLVAGLCSLGRSLVAARLVLGSGGNLSARVPGGDVAAVTARGTWLDRLVPADFSFVRLADGAVLAGAPTPSTELALHLECYRARPDDVAYVGEVRVAPYRHPGTPELATEAAALLADGRCDCVVLSHHGCSVVADSVEMALRRVLNLEEAAKLTLAALLLGDTGTVGPPGYRERLRSLTEGEH